MKDTAVSCTPTRCMYSQYTMLAECSFKAELSAGPTHCMMKWCLVIDRQHGQSGSSIMPWPLYQGINQFILHNRFSRDGFWHSVRLPHHPVASHGIPCNIYQTGQGWVRQWRRTIQGGIFTAADLHTIFVKSNPPLSHMLFLVTPEGGGMIKVDIPNYL